MQKLAEIEAHFKIKSGKNEETHLQNLIVLNEEEMKTNKSWTLNDFSKYINATDSTNTYNSLFDRSQVDSRFFVDINCSKSRLKIDFRNLKKSKVELY